MKRQNVRTLSLIVCTFTYLLIGAAVFDALESENEIEMKRSLLSYEEKIIAQYNISDEDFERIRENALRSRQYRVENQWKFVGALYFSLVVCSVIGKLFILPTAKITMNQYKSRHYWVKNLTEFI